ncbi:hypothetical protein J5N97_022688 [Dioscorea zingiberensis]|uniref:tRNA pseudouridine(55) synthase n=1 Tax=Dioscorea zingiberensis TaxID=325984 RepID=A0A9D5HAT6_9LILI|nr:hypothetical protein J5N97_022688 [Dioscorea zingiberensis]
MKEKHASEEWFKGKLLSQQISVKDALRSLVTTSLESCLGVKSSNCLFRIRLTYIHEEASSQLQCSLQKYHGFKRRKTETKCKEHITDGLCETNETTSGEHHRSESDAVVYRTLNELQDDVFSELVTFPPEQVYNFCKLTISCYRLPVYIGGRYLKVRMLGSGRPFLVEVANARVMPSMVDIQEIVNKINNSKEKYVMVRNLKLVGSEAWNLLREGEAEKQKQYAAVIWISHPLTEDDLHKISSIKNLISRVIEHLNLGDVYDLH